MNDFEFDGLPPLELVAPSEPLAVMEPESEVAPTELHSVRVGVAGKASRYQINTSRA